MFRAQMLAEESLFLRRIMFAMGVCFVLFGIADVMRFDLAIVLQQLVTRATPLAAAILFTLALGGYPHRRILDLSAAGFLTICYLSWTSILLVQVQELMLATISHILLMSIQYFVMPLRVVPSLIIGGSGSAVYLWVIAQTGTARPEDIVGTAFLLGTLMLFGGLAQRRYHRLRRIEWQRYNEACDAMAAQIALEEELRRAANTDGLTGLANRRHFFDRLAAELGRPLRHRRSAVIMLMDLDNFKRINDSYGHDAGDEILCAFARLCEEALRSSDIVCRYGGEEFAVALLDTQLEKAMEVAERIRRVFKNCAVFRNGQQIPTSVSIGITELAATDSSLEDVFKRADTALYRAKNAGRDQSQILPA